MPFIIFVAILGRRDREDDDQGQNDDTWRYGGEPREELKDGNAEKVS